MNLTTLSIKEFISMLMQAGDERSYRIMLMHSQDRRKRHKRNATRAWYGIAYVRSADGRTESLD